MDPTITGYDILDNEQGTIRLPEDPNVEFPARHPAMIFLPVRTVGPFHPNSNLQLTVTDVWRQMPNLLFQWARVLGHPRQELPRL